MASCLQINPDALFDHMMCLGKLQQDIVQFLSELSHSLVKFV